MRITPVDLPERLQGLAGLFRVEPGLLGLGVQDAVVIHATVVVRVVKVVLGPVVERLGLIQHGGFFGGDLELLLGGLVPAVDLRAGGGQDFPAILRGFERALGRCHGLGVPVVVIGHFGLKLGLLGVECLPLLQAKALGLGGLPFSQEGGVLLLQVGPALGNKLKRALGFRFLLGDDVGLRLGLGGKVGVRQFGEASGLACLPGVGVEHLLFEVDGAQFQLLGLGLGVLGGLHFVAQRKVTLGRCLGGALIFILGVWGVCQFLGGGV